MEPIEWIFIGCVALVGFAFGRGGAKKTAKSVTKGAMRVQEAAQKVQGELKSAVAEAREELHPHD